MRLQQDFTDYLKKISKLVFSNCYACIVIICKLAYLCIVNAHPVIFFDGNCNFCQGMVRFIVRRDPAGIFLFAPLAGDYAKKIRGIPENSASLLLLENGKLYSKSTAALRIARRLNAGWPLLYGLTVIPAFIRNFIYDWVASNRYRIGGACERTGFVVKNRLL